MARVLVVDDDEDLRTILAHTLGTKAHEVHQARNGQEALHYHNLADFDLLVTDIVMPDMEGIEFIRRVKKRRPEMPIIAISGGTDRLATEFMEGISVDLGAAVFLSKPFDLDRFLEIVSELTTTVKEEKSL